MLARPLGGPIHVAETHLLVNPMSTSIRAKTGQTKKGSLNVNNVSHRDAMVVTVPPPVDSHFHIAPVGDVTIKPNHARAVIISFTGALTAEGDPLLVREYATYRARILAPGASNEAVSVDYGGVSLLDPPQIAGTWRSSNRTVFHIRKTGGPFTAKWSGTAPFHTRLRGSALGALTYDSNHRWVWSGSFRMDEDSNHVQGDFSFVYDRAPDLERLDGNLGTVSPFSLFRAIVGAP